MPWNRPDLATLISRIRSDLKSSMPSTNPWLRRMLVGILGKVEGGTAHGLYGHQEWIAKQVMVDTCDEDVLARHAAYLGVPRKAPVAASGPILCAGTDGSAISDGTVLTRSDGVEYTVVGDAVVAGGTATATVQCSATGVAGDCDAGMPLTFVSPVTGINAQATVAAPGIAGGFDVEDVEAWRSRVLARLQNPPKAGTSDDYVEWAKEVAGVTRAWCYARELGPGTVTVRVLADDAPDGPIPDGPTVAAVQSYIESVCPVDATPTVAAPIADALAFQIRLLPDSQAVRATVAASLADLIAREAVPAGVIAGQQVGTILLTHIEDAITTGGANDYELLAPTEDVVPTTGHMVTMGAIAWA